MSRDARMASSTIHSQTLRATGTVIILIVTLFIAIALSLGRARIFTLGEHSARVQAESIAARAQFATIADSAAHRAAQSLLTEVVGHNEVLGAALLTGAGAVLASLQARQGVLAQCPRISPAADRSAVPRLSSERRIWCVDSPVFAHQGNRVCRRTHCVLGQLELAISTRPTRLLAANLITAISIMGAVLLAAAMLSLWSVSEHISAPLKAIVAAMRKFSSGDVAATAPEGVGPVEVRTISSVYNQLIARHASHARELEERVAARTLELEKVSRQVQEAERSRTAMVVQLSHEMRTPLHLIQAQAGAALHELEFWREGSRARRNVELVLKESLELAQRVDQVLGFVRSGTADEPIQRNLVHLSRLRTHLRDKYTPLAAERGNTLTVAVDKTCVLIDLDKVLQILNNLIENALKYTSKGAVRVRIKVSEETLRLIVDDNGIGIQADKIEEVWKEFHQAHAPDAPPPEGFGIGLAIVRARVTQLGGECDLASTPGIGTTVEVSLPLRNPEPEQTLA